MIKLKLKKLIIFSRLKKQLLGETPQNQAYLILHPKFLLFLQNGVPSAWLAMEADVSPLKTNVFRLKQCFSHNF